MSLINIVEGDVALVDSEGTAISTTSGTNGPSLNVKEQNLDSEGYIRNSAHHYGKYAGSWMPFSVDDEGRLRIVSETVFSPHTLSGTSHIGQLSDEQIPDYITRDIEVVSVSGSLQLQINNKSDIGHAHTELDITDLDKYTQGEVDTISGSLQSQIDVLTKDHGLLDGLSDDDHPQYHNDSRGDIRYYTKVSLDAGQLDNRYYTETEVDTISGSLQSQIDGISMDHGNLSGLGDDDHPQYHNDSRGDIRYYTKTLLDNGQLDNRYYTEVEVISISGSLQVQINNKSDINHDHTEVDITDLDKYTKLEVDTISGSLQSQIDGISMDHGNLYGLGDDDHPQYHNDSRGDLRYYTKTSLDAGQLDNRYYTENEVNTLSGVLQSQIDGISMDHGDLSGLNDDDHPQYLRTDGNRELSGNWDVGNYSITALEYYGDGSTLSGIAYVDSDDVYFYDTTRSKTLGVAILQIGCGRNSANTTNQYLRTFNGVPMNQTGVALPWDATLIGGVAMGSRNDQTWTVRLRKNDSTTNLASLSVTNAYENHVTNADIDFDEGDRIQIYMDGTNINYPLVYLYFRRRK